MSVCQVHCGKTADRIWMRFGMVDRMGRGMRQVVGFGDRSTEGGDFVSECGTPHCNQWRVRAASRPRGPVANHFVFLAFSFLPSADFAVSL